LTISHEKFHEFLLVPQQKTCANY